MPFPCSFCGVDSNDANYIIKGPGDHQICDGCVEICVLIISDKNYERMRRIFWSELDVTEEMIIEDVNNK
jgi:ATP-dependent protease Clp ATPase subunit